MLDYHLLTSENYDSDNEFHFHSDKTFFVSQQLLSCSPQLRL